ncbi:DNA polymerase I [hydrothermal vent metagenome]|uniref:DNA-directed DNA polymerase n=1 Tax=hydrothermal vent metagenome TaxID=652676 RepID=A0A3B1CZN7_9ZZZZ
MSNKPSLYLIDGHALCYRSFYAIRELTSSTGQATNAVLGFVNTLRKIFREHNPQYLAVCFDSGKKTFRQEKFSAYKIQRPRMPEDLRSQIPIIKDVVAAFNVPIFEKEGYEADDLIAALSIKAVENKIDVVIVTEDKDLYQLANPHVKFFSPRKDEILAYEGVKEKLGFEPGRIVDFIGLAGDKSDNIPGVMGIGKVTAQKLINQYGSLEDILEHLDVIKPPKVKEKIEAQRQEAILSKELAILEAKVPVEWNDQDLKVDEPDNNRLVEIFKELEFQRLAEAFSVQKEGHVLNAVKLCESEEVIEEIKRQAKASSQIVVWMSEGDAEILYLQIQENTFSLSLEMAAQLQDVFDNNTIKKVVYGLKEFLKKVYVKNAFDIKLAGYLLKPVQASFSLTGLAWDFFKESVLEENKDVYIVDLLQRLYPVLVKELNEKKLIKLFNDIEMPLVEVLFKIESEGVCLDTDLLLKLSKECDLKIELLTNDIYKLSGEEFNLNSPKQLSHILFEKLKLPVIKKTKTGFSTNEEVLIKLAQKHEVPVLILEYRKLAKLKSTYIDALPQLINAQTGRIHAEFHQTGTETGRLSSRHPNLQNIPIRTDLGKQIRQAIIPSKGRVMVSADYSQIELRILAHLAEDENLKKAFQTDQDIHQFTASLMFDVKEGEVTSKMRYAAKRVNFGIIYGMSAFGLAKDLDVPQAEAQDFIDRYFLRYPAVKTFMSNEIKKCEENGYVLTLLNRRRYIQEINNRNSSIKQFAERQAINTPVQGSAADLMKLAMINVQKELEKRGLKSRMTITVHDELVFDVPVEEKDEIIILARDVMEHAFEISVPIKVSVKVGQDWLNMEEV